MCTIIAIASPNPRTEFFFLANRDRPAETFRGNYLKYIPDNRILGVYDIRSDGLASGYSLKTEVYGAIANVKGYEGCRSRGVLLKEILTKAKNLTDVATMIERELITGEYSSASYLLGRGGENWLFENLGRTLYAARLGKRHTLTNFFTGLKGNISKEAKERSGYVNRHLTRLTSLQVEDLLRIAAHHVNEGSTCRHGQALASLFVTRRAGGKPKILYCIGEPCQGLHNIVDVYPDLQDSVEF